MTKKISIGELELLRDHERLRRENIFLRKKLHREERKNDKIEKMYKKLVDKLEEEKIEELKMKKENKKEEVILFWKDVLFYAMLFFLGFILGDYIY